MHLKTTDQYPEFKALLEDLQTKQIDYERDLSSVMKNVTRRQSGEYFTLSEHVKGLVYSLLSSQRPWEPIEQNREKIDNIFHNFDVAYLKTIEPETLVKEIKAIKCGNRQIHSQMNNLKDNITTLEKIAAENNSIDTFYNEKSAEELIELLSNPNSKYKIKGFRRALSALYLKNMGILTEKPDTHTRRIIGLWGYSVNSPKQATPDETHHVCQAIAKAYDISIVEVDLIIWKAGETGVAYK